MTQWLAPARCLYCDKRVHVSERKEWHDACFKKARRVGKSIISGKRKLVSR